MHAQHRKKAGVQAITQECIVYFETFTVAARERLNKQTPPGSCVPQEGTHLAPQDMSSTILLPPVVCYMCSTCPPLSSPPRAQLFSRYCSKVAALRIILNIDGCGVHTSLGVYHMSSTIPLPTRDQLCNWSCSNKQQPCPGLIAASAATGKFKAHVTQTCCEPRFDVCHLLLHMTLLFQHFASLASFTLAYATGIFRCKGLQMVE